MIAWIPLVVLALVFLLIAIRQIGNVRLQLWQIMLGGAAVVLLTGSIAPLTALKAINIDVIVFLFCMFLLGFALEESGYLSHLAYHFFKRAKNADALILFILFGAGLASALLMNDTIAIVGTPVVLFLAFKHRISSKLLLLTLAFAVTIGSVMSPIGNPQNLLIALHSGMPDPFLVFFAKLVIPTILNLFLAYLLLRLFYPEQFRISMLFHTPHALQNKQLAVLCKISLSLLLLLILAKIVLVFFGLSIPMVLIAIVAAAPLLFSRQRISLLKGVDWHTLIFFAAMFMLMQSVWDTGFFQTALKDIPLVSVLAILLVSVVVSQFISNVPLVALYLPLIASSATAYVALAAGSTIAGNLFLLGAASNIIIVQQAEKRGETITFWEFARIGIPLTIINVLVYWAFLTM